LTGGDIHGNNSNLHGLSQTNAKACILADDALRFYIVFPSVRSKIGHLDKAFNTEPSRLDKYAKVGKAGDNTIKLVTNLFAQHLQYQHHLQLSFGVLSPLLGKGDVLADFN